MENTLRPTPKALLIDINPRSWEHPADRAALEALKAIPALNEVVKFLLGATGEASLRLLFLASGVRVGPTQFPRVHRLVVEACEVLDIREIPEVYITQTPILNAGAIGAQRPFITLNSGLLSAMDDAELLGIIAHELGHLASGHTLYKTLLWLLVQGVSVLGNLPLGQAAIFGLTAALREWDRKSELSADRAGLLVTQNPQVQFRILMKLAGGTDLGSMNLEDFFRQAADYDQSPWGLDSLHKLLNILGQTHPFPVLRLTELKAWIDGGEYEAILSGDYERRIPNPTQEEEAKTTDDSESTQKSENPADLFSRLSKDFEQAQKAYRDELRRSQDPLAQGVSSLVDKAEQTAEQARKTIEDLLKGRPQ